MPQPERTSKIIMLLQWLIARAKQKNSPYILDTRRYLEREICDMGANPRTVNSYIERCKVQNLIAIVDNRVMCTQTGKNWLERKVS